MVESEEVILQVERILQSPDFHATPKQREFLRFVVQTTLGGSSDKIKGYTIALNVYQRAKEFDPRTDPIVRVEAGRLRRALDQYYSSTGRHDPIRIDIPKGGYVPSFDTQEKTNQHHPKSKMSILDDNTGGEPSIAVMPLANLSGDQGQDYFADGLTEELTVELSRYQEFRVIASQSTMRFKKQPYDLFSAARDLGVRFLLTGTVRKDSKYVKINFSLLDARVNATVWSHSYKRTLNPSELISLQEEIAHQSVGVIADQYGFVIRRLSRDSRKKVPASIQSYDAILSFYHYETVLSSQVFEKAFTALQHAVKMDPEYGLAWAMLGHLYADNHALGFMPIEDSLGKALLHAQKGATFSPEDQFTQDALTLVYFHLGNKKLFLAHVEKTLALNPNAPYVVGVAGWHLMLMGEWKRGRKLLHKGMKLNPYHPTWFYLATFMDYYRQDEYELAYGEAQKFNLPMLFWDPLLRAISHIKMTRLKKAHAAIDELLNTRPDFLNTGRQLIGNYIKTDALIDRIIDDLSMAGCMVLDSRK